MTRQAHKTKATRTRATKRAAAKPARTQRSTAALDQATVRHNAAVKAAATRRLNAGVAPREVAMTGGSTSRSMPSARAAGRPKSTPRKTPAAGAPPSEADTSRR